MFLEIEDDDLAVFRQADGIRSVRDELGPFAVVDVDHDLRLFAALREQRLRLAAAVENATPEYARRVGDELVFERPDATRQVSCHDGIAARIRYYCATKTFSVAHV